MSEEQQPLVVVSEEQQPLVVVSEEQQPLVVVSEEQQPLVPLVCRCTNPQTGQIFGLHMQRSITTSLGRPKQYIGVHTVFLAWELTNMRCI